MTLTTTETITKLKMPTKNKTTKLLSWMYGRTGPIRELRRPMLGECMCICVRCYPEEYALETGGSKVKWCGEREGGRPTFIYVCDERECVCMLKIVD